METGGVKRPVEMAAQDAVKRARADVTDAQKPQEAAGAAGAGERSEKDARGAPERRQEAAGGRHVDPEEELMRELEREVAAAKREEEGDEDEDYDESESEVEDEQGGRQW